MGCIQDSLYECPWYICSKSVRNLILLTIIRCKKPLTLTAGKILIMSLETFVVVSAIKIIQTICTLFKCCVLDYEEHIFLFYSPKKYYTAGGGLK